MKKREADQYLHRCYALLSNGAVSVVIDRIRGVAGQIAGNEVTLNPDYDIVPTFIHECLHHFHPDYNENRILNMERKITRLLTPRQAANLIKRIAEIL